MAKNKISGDYNSISISQIVASTKMRLRIEASDDDIFLERYANEGARHFDSLSTFVKRCCDLELVNGKAKLPNGFYQMLAIGSCNGGSYLYVDTPFLHSNNIPMQSNFVSSNGTFQIQNGYVYASVGASSSDQHGVSVLGGTTSCVVDGSTTQNGPLFEETSVRIWFVGMNVDDNGMMVVYSDMERGLVAYCVWMYMLDSPAGKYTPQQIQANEMIWVNQKNWYKGIQFQNNFRNTRRQVASVANAWITSKSWYM